MSVAHALHRALESALCFGSRVNHGQGAVMAAQLYHGLRRVVVT